MRVLAARLVQDAGVAALFGGNLFGRLAMHPAVEAVSSEAERGQVVNAAWKRFGNVNSLALAGVVGGWAVERREGPLLVKDVAVGAVVVTGVASAVAGVSFGRSAPGGAVPLRSGSEPSAGTPPGAARTKRALNALGQASALAEVALLAVNAASRR